MDNSKLPANLFNLEPAQVRRFEIDLLRGILKADGPEDHAQ